MVQKAAQSAVCRLRNSREKHPQPMNSRRIHLPFFAEKLRSDAPQRLTITLAAATGNHRIDHLEPVREPDERAPC